MVPALTTGAVALLAYLVGRSTLPLFVGRRGDPPDSVLALEMLLGNCLLSIVGLVLAETGTFTGARLVGISALVGALGLAVRSRDARHVNLSYNRNDAVGVAL